MLTLAEVADEPSALTSVLADNPRALRYYEKNGFRAVGTFTGADGGRSLDMILDLGA